MGLLYPEVLRGEEGGSVNLPNSKHSNGYASSIVVKPGAGILYGFTVYNSNASAQFVQVFDLADLPADGVIPACLFSVAATSDKGVEWLNGRPFLTGCVLCNSSTGATKTIGAADCFFDVQYL